MGSKGEPVPYVGVKLPRKSTLTKFAYKMSLPFRSVLFSMCCNGGEAKQDSNLFIYFFMVLPPNAGQGLLIPEVSR